MKSTRLLLLLSILSVVSADYALQYQSQAFGAQHTCAIVKGGILMCSGSNDYGQVGVNNTGSNDASNIPCPTKVDLGLAAYAIAVVTGQQDTCALLSDGRVKCFGRSQDGQLGIGPVDKTPKPSGKGGNYMPTEVRTVSLNLSICNYL
jgi:alpha-tubulin suppressor-like RCC1 family protein